LKTASMNLREALSC